MLFRLVGPLPIEKRRPKYCGALKRIRPRRNFGVWMVDDIRIWTVASNEGEQP